MSQSPKEIVRAAVHFDGPERLPVRMACFGCDDTAGIPWKSRDVRDDGRKADEWGCRWQQSDLANMGQVKGHPLGELSEHGRVNVPDYGEDWRYEDSEEAVQAAERGGRYTQAGIFMVLFERMHSLAGFENVLMGLLTDRENAEALADKILDAHLCLVLRE